MRQANSNGVEVSEVRDSAVERAYPKLRDMAIRYDFRPGDRINELELAKQLQISRTPLREALNRLYVEGLLEAAPGRGFAARALCPKEVFSLYEFRTALETSATALACEKATPDQIRGIEEFVLLSKTEPDDDDIDYLLDLDEQFHERLVLLTGNAEFLRALKGLNARIRFVRWVAMRGGQRRHTQQEHLAIVNALQNRNSAKARELVGCHIERRMDQIVDVIRIGIGEIYLK